MRVAGCPSDSLFAGQVAGELIQSAEEVAMLILANTAKPRLLRYKRPYLNSCTIRLFQNEWTPAGGDAASDYVEASFVGYSAQPLNDFGLSYLNGSGQGQMNSCAHVWRQGVATPANLIYGYYVTDRAGWLVFAERRAGPPVEMAAVGAEYSLSISFLEDTLR
jgi:hypothetical protein